MLGLRPPDFLDVNRELDIENLAAGVAHCLVLEEALHQLREAGRLHHGVDDERVFFAENVLQQAEEAGEQFHLFQQPVVVLRVRFLLGQVAHFVVHALDDILRSEGDGHEAG